MPISLKARASKRRLIIRGLCVCEWQKRREIQKVACGNICTWSMKPRSSHSSPSSHIFSDFHFPSLKFPPSSSTICRVSWHTCPPSLTEGWEKMKVGRSESAAGQGGCRGVLRTAIHSRWKCGFPVWQRCTARRWWYGRMDEEREQTTSAWMLAQLLCGCLLNSKCAVLRVFFGKTIRNFQQRICNYATCITLNTLKINVPLLNAKKKI